MSTSAKANSKSQGASEAKRQILRAMIDQCIGENFAKTLGPQNDITNIVLSLMLLESHWRTDAVGPVVSTTISSGARDYYNSQVVQNVVNNGSTAQKINLYDGIRAQGLMQVMGWNVIKGASKKNGKCVIETVRPDLVSLLCVNPGDSVSAVYLGDANIHRAITAGLAILESKWLYCKKTADGWQIGNFVFPLRISASVAGYLGLGAKDVVTKLTPQAYAASIVGGDSYQVANGASAPVIRDSNVQYASTSAAGPVQTSASGTAGAVAGCAAKA